jgi:hypothetical protein
MKNQPLPSVAEDVVGKAPVEFQQQVCWLSERRTLTMPLGVISRRRRACGASARRDWGSETPGTS